MLLLIERIILNKIKGLFIDLSITTSLFIIIKTYTTSHVDRIE